MATLVVCEIIFGQPIEQRITTLQAAR